MEMEEDEIQFRNSREPISWDAHEYVHVEKTPDWYWALGLIAVAGTVAAILFQNLLFAVLILVMAFVLALFAKRKPEVFRFSVTQRGVRIDDTLYPYSSLEWFSIDELSPNHVPKLILNPKHFFAPVIVIPILDVDPDEVHDFLIAFLDEEDHPEPVIHRIMEWLGF